MVILKENQLWQTNFQIPNRNFTDYKDTEVWVIDDNSELGQKIFNLGVLWEPILDPDGNLIDVLDTYQDERMLQQLNDAKENKLKEISDACYENIINGIDVLLSDNSLEHFSLKETDQINLATAYNEINQGALNYPYHADGQLCKLYSAKDIVAINNASISHKIYHTTYCNHLFAWIKRATTEEELETITYGAELPEDLAANMNEILNNIN